MIEGGHIHSLEEFLAAILDYFNEPTKYGSDTSGENSSITDRAGRLGAPPVVSYEQKTTSGSKESSTFSHTFQRSPTSAAHDALNGGGRPLVIDDFHYIPSDVQLDIVRFLKGLVFDGLPVIFVSVPHRAYDAVRVEREMTGRVQVLNVGFWTNEELLEIPRKGFEALNVEDSDWAISKRLVSETFSSPHLMQEFCKGVCQENGISGRNDVRASLKPPTEGWKKFLQERASSSSKSAFDRLARGPRQRSDRNTRELKDGRTVDIYGVVLEAIANTGPLISTTWEQLRAAIRQIMSDDPPQRHEVTRVLDEMSKIARDKIEGEPVVDWDSEMGTLHISDPYFAYYLKWGTREAVEISGE